MDTEWFIPDKLTHNQNMLRNAISQDIILKDDVVKFDEIGSSFSVIRLESSGIFDIMNLASEYRAKKILSRILGPYAGFGLEIEESLRQWLIRVFTKSHSGLAIEMGFLSGNRMTF